MAYQALEPDGVYDEFVAVNEEILDSAPENDLEDYLDGIPIKIFCSSDAMSRLHSLQYAYLLTRCAEKAVSEGRFEKALIVLAEACYFSGFAEGQGMAHTRTRAQANSTLGASNAAKLRHMRQSAPVQKRFLGGCQKFCV